MPKQRIRWFKMELDRASLRALADKLSECPYSAKRGHGFILEDVRSNYLTARHVEKIEKDIVSIDPAGRESRQHLVLFSNILFTLSTDMPGLETVESPRSLRSFFFQLGSVTRNEIAIAPCRVDPIEWFNQLKAATPGSVVRELEYAGIAFGRDVLGNLRVHGSADVRDAAAKIVGSRKATVQRLKVLIKRPGLPDQLVQLDRDAKAIVLAPDGRMLYPALRTALTAALAATDSKER